MIEEQSLYTWAKIVASIQSQVARERRELEDAQFNLGQTQKNIDRLTRSVAYGERRLIEVMRTIEKEAIRFNDPESQLQNPTCAMVGPAGLEPATRPL